MFIYLNDINVYNLFSKKQIFMENINFKKLTNLVRVGDMSPVTLTEYYLNRIHNYNTDLNAFITVLEKDAISEAKIAEKEISNGNYRGPLHGIPYGVKDIINTAGVRTTNGSEKYDNFFPDSDAFCIKKMRDAGAVLIGKTNTHQYAAASTTINNFYGSTKNPHDKNKIAGGSSGGSASAVAASLVPIALGSDTGGSIRTPASLCGIVGFKPTYGAISLDGVFPNSPSIDHLGPMGESVISTAITYRVLEGYNSLDTRSIQHERTNLNHLDEPIKGFKIAMCPDLYENQEIDRVVQESYINVINILRDLGAEVSEIKFEEVKLIQNLFYDIAGPEFTRVHRKQYEEDPNSFDPDVKKRMDWSINISIDDYLRAMEDKVKMTRLLELKLEKFDALISPSVPFTAPRISDLMVMINDQNYDYTKNLHRQFFAPYNVTGLPAIVLPNGKDKNNMPTSMQIVGKRWCENIILQIANNIERNIMYNKTINF